LPRPPKKNDITPPQKERRPPGDTRGRKRELPKNGRKESGRITAENYNLEVKKPTASSSPAKKKRGKALPVHSTRGREKKGRSF